MPRRNFYANIFIIGDDKRVTEPLFKQLKAIRKMVVRHYRIRERDIRDIERASWDTSINEMPYQLDAGKTPYAIQVQMVGSKENDMMEVVCTLIDRATREAGRDLNLVPYWTSRVKGVKAIKKVMRASGLVSRPKLKLTTPPA